MTTRDLSWRVSVATLDRVVFPRPHDGSLMLALERKATLVSETGNRIRVRAQPFGGAVRIRNSAPLQELVGDIKFDSERSQFEQDFRILIPPSDWEAIKQFCLQHLEDLDDRVLESDPGRELVEEFTDALKINLKRDQYSYQPAGFVAENDPTPTDNLYVRGQPTVRLYRIFEVRIVDDALCAAMLTHSQRYSDQNLETLAREDFQSGGKGRANAILTLPLELITDSYLAVSPEMRYSVMTVENHQLDVSVAAVLESVDIPQYEKL